MRIMRETERSLVLNRELCKLVFCDNYMLLTATAINEVERR